MMRDVTLGTPLFFVLLLPLAGCATVTADVEAARTKTEDAVNAVRVLRAECNTSGAQWLYYGATYDYLVKYQATLRSSNEPDIMPKEVRVEDPFASIHFWRWIGSNQVEGAQELRGHVSKVASEGSTSKSLTFTFKSHDKMGTWPLACLPDLVELKLNDCNNFAEDGLAGLCRLSKLTKLSLERSNLVKVDVGDCVALQELYLAGSEKIESVEELAKLNNLEIVSLNGCTGLKSVEGLAELGRLRTVSLNECTSISSLKPLLLKEVTVEIMRLGANDNADLAANMVIADLEDLHALPQATVKIATTDLKEAARNKLIAGLRQVSRNKDWARAKFKVIAGSAAYNAYGVAEYLPR